MVKLARVAYSPMLGEQSAIAVAEGTRPAAAQEDYESQVLDGNRGCIHGANVIA